MDSSDTSSSPPPPYFETDTRSSRNLPKTEDAAVTRLRRCFVWRMAIDWRIKMQVPRAEAPSYCEYSHFKHLCKNYCKLLGDRFDSVEEAEMAKQELVRDVFIPAEMLGLPSDLVEFFLFSVRYVLKHHDRFSGRTIAARWGDIKLIRIILDYRIIIDVATRDVAFAGKLEEKCSSYHRCAFRWMLGPELLDLAEAMHMQPPSICSPKDRFGYWPNLMHLYRQSRRPCAALMSPSESFSHSIADFPENEHSATTHRHHPPSVFKTTASLWSWQNKLPGYVCCGRVSFGNPDGPPGGVAEMSASQNGYYTGPVKGRAAGAKSRR